jgi:hypothetical protein
LLEQIWYLGNQETAVGVMYQHNLESIRMGLTTKLVLLNRGWMLIRERLENAGEAVSHNRY